MKTTKQTTALYKTERVWLYAALTTLCVAAGMYVYFVSASIHHVVMRKEIDHEISLLSSHVSELESSYIQAQHAVSADIASMHGFVQANHKIFVDRSDTTLVMSHN